MPLNLFWCFFSFIIASSFYKQPENLENGSNRQQMRQRPCWRNIEDIGGVKNEEFQQHVKAEKVQYLLFARGQTLSQTGCTRKQWEDFHQRMVGRHKAQRQILHVLTVLARMVVIKALWSRHCLPSNGYCTATSKSPNCIYERECRNRSIECNIAAACETDSSFNDRLHFATGLRDCRRCRCKCLILLAYTSNLLLMYQPSIKAQAPTERCRKGYFWFPNP